MLRQVDDFAIACEHEWVAKEIYNIIGEKLKLPSETEAPFTYLGMVYDFNGTEVDQSRDYIALSCPNYISRLLRTHGWDTRSNSEQGREAPLYEFEERTKSGTIINRDPTAHSSSINRIPAKNRGLATVEPEPEPPPLTACNLTDDNPSDNDPRFPIGTPVTKSFKQGTFSGKVVSYDPVSSWYKICYTDDDEEELTEAEMIKIMDTPPAPLQRVTTRSQSKSDTTLVDDHSPLGTSKYKNTLSSDDESLQRPISPLPQDAIKHIYAKPGPHEETDPSGHKKLEERQGFSFRSLLGELMYAYTSCRPDIGYAVVTLSKYAACPDHIHYAYLKGVAKYLRRTIHWGIRFKRRTPDLTLPASRIDLQSTEPDLPDFPQPEHPLDLQAFVDAAHANNLRNRRSQTGYAIMLSGGVIAYRSKTQTVTATSSTEAEFLAAVSAAKTVKYLRAVMNELGYAHTKPTPIYEDNMAAIKIVNARKPTERTRHIDIQHFAIQDWKEAGDLEMRFIPGVVNPADDLTKPLGWVLHARHARRFMGHYT